MSKLKEKRVVVIILNYLNYMETDACIQSVLKQEYPDFYILVVDNGSDNESYRYLGKKYRNHTLVSVIRARKNYGFAKGNNIGIRYAKKKLNAEYVMLLNSDTLIFDTGYMQELVESDSGRAGVIGSGIIQSGNTKLKKICRYVDFPSTLFYYLESAADYWNFCWSQYFWNKMLMKYEGTHMIQGCMLLLTPMYFQYYDGLDPRTFLYCEEELLYLRCKKADLEQIVNDHVCIWHKCGQSTKLVFDTTKKNYLKYMLPSYKYVLWESFKMTLRKRE